MPEWDQLTKQQRQVMIDALRERWDDVPEERPRMYRHARRWLDMTPEQRKQAKAGMDRFRNMSPSNAARPRPCSTACARSTRNSATNCSNAGRR